MMWKNMTSGNLLLLLKFTMKRRPDKGNSGSLYDRCRMKHRDKSNWMVCISDSPISSILIVRVDTWAHTLISVTNLPQLSVVVRD